MLHVAVSGEAEQHNKDTGQRQAVERKVDVDVGEVVALDEDHHVEVAGEIGVDRLVVHCHGQRLSRSEPVGGFFHLLRPPSPATWQSAQLYLVIFPERLATRPPCVSSEWPAAFAFGTEYSRTDSGGCAICRRCR